MQYIGTDMNIKTNSVTAHANIIIYKVVNTIYNNEENQNSVQIEIPHNYSFQNTPPELIIIIIKIIIASYYTTPRLKAQGAPSALQIFTHYNHTQQTQKHKADVCSRYCKDNTMAF